MYHTVRKPSRNLIKSTREIQQTLIRIIKESVTKFFFQWLVFNDSMKRCSCFFVLLHTCCTVELLHISQRGKNCLAVVEWCLLYGHFMFLLVRVKSADLYTVKMQKSKCCCGIAGYSNEPWKKEHCQWRRIEIFMCELLNMLKWIHEPVSWEVERNAIVDWAAEFVYWKLE